MQDFEHKDYRAAMKRIELPERTRDAVRGSWRDVREGAVAEATARTVGRGGAGAAAHRRPARAPRRRGLRLAAGFAAAAVLAVLALAVLPFTGRSFALSAYASGSPLEMQGDIVTVLDDFASWGGWFSFDESDWGEDADPYEDGFIVDTGMDAGYICAFNFNLDCQGEGIERLAYELDGEGVYFRFDPARGESVAPEDFSPWSFSAKPGELSDSAHGYVYLVANVPMSATPKLADLSGALSSLDAVRDADAWSATSRDIDAIVRTRAAAMLGESTLAVTATFVDGSTERHVYRIAPVDDFEVRYREMRSNLEEGAQESMGGLFTIELLEVKKAA